MTNAQQTSNYLCSIVPLEDHRRRATNKGPRHYDWLAGLWAGKLCPVDLPGVGFSLPLVRMHPGEPMGGAGYDPGPQVETPEDQEYVDALWSRLMEDARSGSAGALAHSLHALYCYLDNEEATAALIEQWDKAGEVRLGAPVHLVILPRYSTGIFFPGAPKTLRIGLSPWYVLARLLALRARRDIVWGFLKWSDPGLDEHERRALTEVRERGYSLSIARQAHKVEQARAAKLVQLAEADPVFARRLHEMLNPGAQILDVEPIRELLLRKVGAAVNVQAVLAPEALLIETLRSPLNMPLSLCPECNTVILHKRSPRKKEGATVCKKCRRRAATRRHRARHAAEETGRPSGLKPMKKKKPK